MPRRRDHLERRNRKPPRRYFHPERAFYEYSPPPPLRALDDSGRRLSRPAANQPEQAANRRPAARWPRVAKGASPSGCPSWVPNPLGLFLASPDALQSFALLPQQSRQFPQYRPRAALVSVTRYPRLTFFGPPFGSEDQMHDRAPQVQRRVGGVGAAPDAVDRFALP